MKTLYIDKKTFLDWYFRNINFNDNIYIDLLIDEKYSLNIYDLLECIQFVPHFTLIPNQEIPLNKNGLIDESKVNFIFK